MGIKTFVQLVKINVYRGSNFWRQVRYSTESLIKKKKDRRSRDKKKIPTFDGTICQGFVRSGSNQKPLASEDDCMHANITYNDMHFHRWFHNPIKVNFVLERAHVTYIKFTYTKRFTIYHIQFVSIVCWHLCFANIKAGYFPCLHLHTCLLCHDSVIAQTAQSTHVLNESVSK